MSDCSEPWMSCDLCGASPEQPCQDPDRVEKTLRKAEKFLANHETVGVNGEEPHWVTPGPGGSKDPKVDYTRPVYLCADGRHTNDFEEAHGNNSNISPDHYSRFEIEPIDFIMANKLGFSAGNVIKYVVRADAKNGIEDLKKARRYIDFMIAEAVGDQPSSAP